MMKRLVLSFALACVAGCTYPNDTKMEPVEPTDAQMQNAPSKDPSKTPRPANQ
jgi:hypothetical protein